MRRFATALLIAAAFFVLTAGGCETMKGVGKDITSASTSVQQTFFE